MIDERTTTRRREERPYDEDAANFGAIPVASVASDGDEELDNLRVTLAATNERDEIWLDDQMDRYVASKRIGRSPAPNGEVVATIIAGWRAHDGGFRILGRVGDRYHILRTTCPSDGIDDPAVGQSRRFGTESKTGRALLPKNETTDYERVLGITVRIGIAIRDLVITIRSRKGNK